MKTKHFLLLFFLLTSLAANAQISWDTTRQLSRHEGGYGKFKPSFKTSIFYDGNIGIEAVRVRNHLSLAWLMNNTATKYYGLQWIANPHYKFGLLGLKAGAEADFTFLHLGASAGMQTNFEKLKFNIAPEIGLSWWGTVGIYYAFIIPLNNEPFLGTQNYQLGIKYNFTKQLFSEFKKGVSF